MATKMVSTVIIQEDRVLLIREDSEEQEGLWNIPSGVVQAGEKIMDAAIRETRTKTGLDVDLISLSGIYQFVSATGKQLVRNVFTAKVIGGSVEIDGKEIIEAKWFSFPEIDQLEDEVVCHVHSLRRVFEDVKKMSQEV